MMATYGIQTQTPHEVNNCFHWYSQNNIVTSANIILHPILGGTSTNLVVDPINQDISAIGSKWEDRINWSSASAGRFTWHKQSKRAYLTVLGNTRINK